MELAIDLSIAISCWIMATEILVIWWLKHRVSNWHKTLTMLSFAAFLMVGGIKRIAQLEHHYLLQMELVLVVTTALAAVLFLSVLPWILKMPTSVEWNKTVAELNQKNKELQDKGLEITELRVRERVAEKARMTAVRDQLNLIAGQKDSTAVPQALADLKAYLETLEK